MYALDADFCIEILRGREPALDSLRQLSGSAVGVPSIVRAELLVGAHKSRSVEANIIRVEALLRPLRSIPFDDIAAVRYGIIRAALEVAGRRIGWNDMLIAATALAHDATLITRNWREFIRIPGLRVKSWED